MSDKLRWCVPGSNEHPDCPNGYVYLCGVFEVEEAYDFDYQDVRIGFRVFDLTGELLSEQKAVFVLEEEYLKKNG